VKINNTFILFVILLSQVVLGQAVKSKKVHEKYDSVAVEGVNIVNLDKITRPLLIKWAFSFLVEGDV
jgi:hypothetical protein